MRLLFWNGIADIPVAEKWFYTDGTTTYDSEQTPLNGGYPRMTPYSEFPTTSDTLNINWFRETPLFPNGEALLGEGVYERYWNQYIQELYSPLARVFTGYFNLNSNDLRDLSFDDVIFIKNAYYRILKVHSAPLAETSTVKVELVKILDTVQFGNSGTPDPSGGGIDDIIAVGGGGATSGTSGTGGSYYYFVASDCDGVEPNIVVRSNISYALGVVVSVSGSGYLGTCWTLVDYHSGPHDTTVLDVFATCVECQSL